MQVSEDVLRRECGFYEPVSLHDTTGALGEEGEVLAAYKTEGNPAEYLDAYRALIAFVEKSLDAYKVGAVLNRVVKHPWCFYFANPTWVLLKNKVFFWRSGLRIW